MLKVGDTIKCTDAAEAINTMSELSEKNIQTDFLFEVKGQKGLWLVVERIFEEIKRINKNNVYTKLHSTYLKIVLRNYRMWSVFIFRGKEQILWQKVRII